MRIASTNRASKNELEPVWRALADPTRRRILDLLREGPKTTGDLASRFEVSRYGVMKHLKVLVEARLVVVERRWRERWNHLNPVPIQQIHRRWIRPFAARGADALLDLKEALEADEQAKGRAEMSEQSGATAFDVLEVVHEVKIEAPPERVWAALTNESSAWWPKGFYVSSEPCAFVIENEVGGRVYEDAGDGQGFEWYRVIGIEAPRVLRLAGDLGPDWGGPARLLTTFKLEPDGKATVLRLSETIFGRLSQTLRGNMETGWNQLLSECLKPWVEEGRHPERPASLA